ncbi:MAG: class II fructose-bisphosphate aldolase [Anaerotignum sp.]
MRMQGVVIEAELGKLAGVEDDVKVDAANATYTDPDQAVDFVKRTGVDSLAIAIGTSHGAYKFKGEAKLDFDRLETITKKLEDAGFIISPLYCMVLFPSSRDALQCAMNLVVKSTVQKVSLRKCCVKHLPWLFAKSTWTQTASGYDSCNP